MKSKEELKKIGLEMIDVLTNKNITLEELIILKGTFDLACIKLLEKLQNDFKKKMES